jgi:hypothetical protein
MQNALRRTLALTVFLSFFSIVEEARALTKNLSPPSGKFGVSRVGYDWVDASRHETVSSNPRARRELMVYVWYPADKKNDNPRAAYLPGAELIAKSMENGDIKQLWGDDWPSIASGEVGSETYDHARIAPGIERFPLLIFSPGLGIPSTTYTSLIQELVSHGYIVASIEPTYEIAAVAFPDGRVIADSPQATGRDLPSPPGDTKEKFLKRMHAFDALHIDKWATDIRFVIDQITLLNETAGKNRAPFANRIDLSKVAAWGHSFGGRAAARACQLDQRIKACLNADGLGPDGPIFRYEGASLPVQPFMWMEVFHEPPTDVQLEPYKMTRKDWERDHQAQLTIESSVRDAPIGKRVIRTHARGSGYEETTGNL